MHLRTHLILGILLLSGTAAAQGIGQVTPVALPGGSAALTLDFSDRDYELILFSTVADEQDTARTFSYTVTGSAVSAKPVALRRPAGPVQTDRDRLEALLRQEERELAGRIRQQGGWSPPARKAAQPLQAARAFTFSKFGGVTSDRTVQSTLVASNSRAGAYLDDNLAGAEVRINTADIQAMLDRFSNINYDVITSAFGGPSDVDGNGQVIFLFTPLVDQVGGVAGFYSARSLFSLDEGGNGNQADMMFIGLDHDLDFYDPLLAHEFQHLINYNQHVLVRRGDSEESWLNEALSHYTEDLVGGHVTGDLPRLYGPFLEAPGAHSLVGDASLNNGIRGAAYLFLRGLIEDFGADIAIRLVKTGRAGIANVEAETGRSFPDLYQDYASRLFLTGSGLNSAPQVNYAFSFFTEPATGRRSLPLPRESGLSADGPAVTGVVKPLAPAFLRLMGNAAGGQVAVQTEAAGAFRAVLIAVPRDYQPRTALAADYFPQLTFDAPLEGEFTAGQGKTLSGAVSDPAVSRISFRFSPVAATGDTISFFADVTNGRFARSILIHPSQAGGYALEIFMGQKGAPSLPPVGRFASVTVSPGDGMLSIPADYFPGITLDAPLPGVYPAGEGIRVSGSVADPAVSQVSLKFEALGGGNEDVSFFMDVAGGRFERSIVFDPSQAGDYRLLFFAGQQGQSLPFVDDFSFVTVTEGGGEVNIPADFFSGILLDAPLPASHRAGQGASFSGRVTDTSIEVLLMTLTPEGGGEDIRIQTDVTNGTFRKGFVFFPEQAGNYTLNIFGGPDIEGGRLSDLGSFSPFTVTAEGNERVFIPVDALDGVLLDAPLETVFFVDKSIRLSGSVTAPSVVQLLFRFDPLDGSGEPIRFFTSASGGRFSRTVTFLSSQTGSYELIIFGGPENASTLSGIDRFSPFQVLPAQPDILVRKTTFDFGEVFVGQAGTRALTILNPGSQDLSVSGIASDNAAFTASPGAFSIAPGDSATVTLTFAPTSAGGIAGSILVSSNDPDRPTVQVALSGTGALAPVPQLALRVTSLDFGSVEVGQTAERRFTIRNTGAATLQIDNVTGSGDPFGAILPTVIPVFRIAPGDSVEVTVSFTPQSAGSFTGALSLTGNAPTVRLSLIGSATEPDGGGPVTVKPSPDFNGDGLVAFGDFVVFAQAFGAKRGEAKYQAIMDLDGNGELGFRDFLIFAQFFGKDPSTFVPPGS